MIKKEKNETKAIKTCSIPAIGLGTYGLKGKDGQHAIIDAIEIGYRHIDTAQYYDNEQDVGTSIHQSGIHRNEIFLTDKIWWSNLDPTLLRQTFEESLEKLQTDYIDLLLIHWPSPDGVPLEDSLSVMSELKRHGKIKHIGVSNFNADLLHKAMALETIVCNQIEYHPFLSQKKMIEKAKAHDFFVTAYSPLAQGKTLKNKVIQQIGKKYGKSEAQIALHWLISQDNVLTIPRSSSHANRKSNLAIFDFELSKEDMDAITQLTLSNERTIDPDFAPKWD